MKNYLALCLFFLFSFSAVASGISLNTSNPPTPAFGFSYPEAAQYYNLYSTPPSAQSLAGNWIHVGIARLSTFHMASMKDEYISSGIKNNDGSLHGVLQFLQFEGFDEKPLTSVTFLNLGCKDCNQGDFRVDFNLSNATFAQWVYRDNETAHDAHFEYECRLGKTNLDKMICAVTYRVDDPSTAHPAYQDFDGHVVAFYAYIRSY
jgi:hypothetical protein